jgi:hypothetical protein
MPGERPVHRVGRHQGHGPEERTLPIEAGSIAEELKLLRKGRGIASPDLLERRWPWLRRLAQVIESDDLPTARHKLTDLLTGPISRLAADLVAVTQVSLGLRGDSPTRFLDDRVDLLRAELGRERRTIYRRMDDAYALIESELLDRARRDAASHGWYVERFDAVVRLDTPTPEADETRRIRVVSPVLTEIVNSSSIPRPRQPSVPGPRLISELVYGGRVRPGAPGEGPTVSTVIELPRELHIDDVHTYRLRQILPPGAPMVPHYTLIPLRLSQLFTVRIRFRSDALPRCVWRVEETTQREIDDARPSGTLLTPDADGEVYQEFHDLKIGYGYGVQWTP